MDWPLSKAIKNISFLQLFFLVALKTIGSKLIFFAFQYITSSMRALGWDVEMSISDQETPIGIKKFTNIIATLDPDAPRRLVIACHYDSKLTDDRGRTGFLGATDSAVPCSQMINLAHTMKGNLSAYSNGVKSGGVSKKHSLI